MNDKVLIKWTQQAAYIEDGIAFGRSPGDEDYVERSKVQGLIDSGKAKVIDDSIPTIDGSLVEKAAQMYRQGYSWQDIADAVDRAVSTVKNWKYNYPDKWSD